jgi:hypothetical protein
MAGSGSTFEARRLMMQHAMRSPAIDGPRRTVERRYPCAVTMSLEVADTPEQRLMAAVLLDAIHCYRRHASSPDRTQRRLHNDAARWIGNRDTAWPYSFENVCSTLGLDASTIRRRLRARSFGMERRAGQPGLGALGRCAA